MDTFNFLFPNYCVICKKESKEALCLNCLRELKKHKLRYDHHRCKKCSHKLVQNICLFCTSRHIYFDKLIGLYEYNDFTKKILLSWKYENNENIYRIFIKDLIKVIQLEQPDRLGFISSSKFGKQYRSYDVLEKLVKTVSIQTNIPYGIDIIKIKKNKQSQKKQVDRFFHTLFSFRLTHNIIGINKYLLIEDTTTTGATINEVSRMLKDNGIKTVIILSIFLEEFEEESIWNPSYETNKMTL